MATSSVSQKYTWVLNLTGICCPISLRAFDDNSRAYPLVVVAVHLRSAAILLVSAKTSNCLFPWRANTSCNIKYAPIAWHWVFRQFLWKIEHFFRSKIKISYQKSIFFVKNQNFLSFFETFFKKSIFVLSKIEITCQKSKFLAKNQNLVKDQHFVKNPIFCEKKNP